MTRMSSAKKILQKIQVNKNGLFFRGQAIVVEKQQSYRGQG